MIKKVAYFSYPTTNMDRAVDFYRHVLGFKLLFHREDWSEFDMGGMRLALKKVSVSGWETIQNTPYLSFIALPIEKTLKDLSEKGVRITHPLECFSYGKLAGFLDPDGNFIGLYEPPPGNSEKEP